VTHFRNFFGEDRTVRISFGINRSLENEGVRRSKLVVGDAIGNREWYELDERERERERERVAS